MVTSCPNAVQRLYVTHVLAFQKLINVWRQINSIALYTKASIKPGILGAKIGKKS